MRLLIASIILTAAALPAAASSPTQTAQQEAHQFLAKCPSSPKDERDFCLWRQKEFVWDYVSAKSGDYDDQRNVAFMLQHGSDGAITVNMFQACAWHLYFTSSGDSRIRSSDLVVAGEVCSSLPREEDHLLAATRAARIAADIRITPARKLPELKYPTAPCKGPLDGTAYRLGEGPPIKPGHCS